MKKLLFKNFPHLLHGADYNPEQWKGYSSVLEDDMRLMKKAGFVKAVGEENFFSHVPEALEALK